MNIPFVEIIAAVHILIFYFFCRRTSPLPLNSSTYVHHFLIFAGTNPGTSRYFLFTCGFFSEQQTAQDPRDFLLVGWPRAKHCGTQRLRCWGGAKSGIFSNRPVGFMQFLLIFGRDRQQHKTWKGYNFVLNGAWGPGKYLSKRRPRRTLSWGCQRASETGFQKPTIWNNQHLRCSHMFTMFSESEWILINLALGIP